MMKSKQSMAKQIILAISHGYVNTESKRDLLIFPTNSFTETEVRFKNVKQKNEFKNFVFRAWFWFWYWYLCLFYMSNEGGKNECKKLLIPRITGKLCSMAGVFK